MIDHIGITVSNYQKSVAFYKLALAPLGYELFMEVDGFAGFAPKNSTQAIANFWIHEGKELTHNLHIAFSAKNHKIVDEFYKIALAAGAKDNGKPDLREIYHPNYYAAFVLDPDGHNLEAVCHNVE